jgi:hypothetical protein
MVDHGLGFQQIQGGQQIGILDLPISGKRHSWLTGAIAGLYFILNKFNLLASLNLLEKMYVLLLGFFEPLDPDVAHPSQPGNS